MSKNKRNFEKLFNEQFMGLSKDETIKAFCFLFGGFIGTFDSSYPKASLTKKQIFEMLEDAINKGGKDKV